MEAYLQNVGIRLVVPAISVIVYWVVSGMLIRRARAEIIKSNMLTTDKRFHRKAMDVLRWSGLALILFLAAQATIFNDAFTYKQDPDDHRSLQIREQKVMEEVDRVASGELVDRMRKPKETQQEREERTETMLEWRDQE